MIYFLVQQLIILPLVHCRRAAITPKHQLADPERWNLASLVLLLSLGLITSKGIFYNNKRVKFKKTISLYLGYYIVNTAHDFNIDLILCKMNVT